MADDRPLEGVALVGATGTGKTALSLALVDRLRAEIACCDSRQIYRGLDVATGKPGAEVRAAVPHHLFDLFTPSERSSAGRYARAAGPVLDAIRERGRLPLLVGGTGFYLEALRFGLPDIPPIPETTIRDLEQSWEEGSSDALYAELVSGDPRAAATLTPADRRRVVRALAVLRETGRPFSEWLADHLQNHTAPLRRLLVVVLDLPRPVLHRRLDERTLQFFEAGLLEEVRTLLDEGVPPDAPGFSSLGYREAVDVALGRSEPAAAVARAQQATRQYAKRQGTWFRGRGARGGVEVLSMAEHTVASAADWIAGAVARAGRALP